MKRVLMVTLLVCLSVCISASGADDPTGEWLNVDLRSIESTSTGCLRLWIEERAYVLKVVDGKLVGVYRNMIRGTPLGAPSFLSTCAFHQPAKNPVASQIRTWGIDAETSAVNQWRITAKPGLRGGDQLESRFEPFKTMLTLRGGRLIDATGKLDDPTEAMVFRKLSKPPSAARAMLEATMKRLESGECLEVLAEMGQARAIAVRACDLRERIAGLAGSYVGVKVDSETEFDRIPIGFPQMNAATRERQHGVFFSFTSQYARQEIPGNAILYEEGGKWRVAFIF